MKLFLVEDEHLWCVGKKYSNRKVCAILSLLQFFVTAGDTCLANCTFSAYMTADIIIFDFGLFHELWGIPGCVAQQLDGGYGRFAWCCCHLLALVGFLATTPLQHVQPAFLWPFLIQQSIYGIGLLILSIAGLPKLVPIIAEGRKNSWLLPSFVYAIGASFNFFLLYVFWHYYWFVEAEYKRLFSPAPGRTRGAGRGPARRRSLAAGDLPSDAHSTPSLVRRLAKPTTLSVNGSTDKATTLMLMQDGASVSSTTTGQTNHITTGLNNIDYNNDTRTNTTTVNLAMTTPNDVMVLDPDDEENNQNSTLIMVTKC